MKAVQKYKMCRRLGSGVFEKCQTSKFVLSEARHGKSLKGKRRKRISSYGLQFIEKQKVRFMYGISEKQFSNYIKEATKHKGEPTNEYLAELLESRLDNIVYRMGLANTRRFARQMVSHGHFMVNGKKSTIPSQRIFVGNTISVREGSTKTKLFTGLSEKLKDYTMPSWLKFDLVKLSGSLQGKPKNDEGFLDLNTVLEFYSR